MKEQEFRDWLFDQKYKKNTCLDKISNCKKVERTLGDLDIHYSKDKGESILFTLSYSKEDINYEPVPIKGNMRNGLATLRCSVRRYMRFREETSLR